MPKLGLETDTIDQDIYHNSVRRFREAQIALPTFAQLADPSMIPTPITTRLADVDPKEPHPLNLYRVHWSNDRKGRGFRTYPSISNCPSPTCVRRGSSCSSASRS